MRLATLYNLCGNQALKLKIDKVKVIRATQMPLTGVFPL